MKASITSDGVSVWVNNGECCLGRFGKMGIDVHRAYDPTSTDDRECLHCTHSLTTPEDWPVFVAKMKEHHGVQVAERHKPERFKTPCRKISAKK